MAIPSATSEQTVPTGGHPVTPMEPAPTVLCTNPLEIKKINRFCGPAGKFRGILRNFGRFRKQNHEWPAWRELAGPASAARKLPARASAARKLPAGAETPEIRRCRKVDKNRFFGDVKKLSIFHYFEVSDSNAAKITPVTPFSSSEWQPQVRPLTSRCPALDIPWPQ